MEQIERRIPPIDRIEWVQIVTGEIKHKFKNFVLQMKSYDYSNRIKDGEINPSTAVNELYSLCQKYSLALQEDFKTIFKEW